MVINIYNNIIEIIEHIYNGKKINCKDDPNTWSLNRKIYI